MVGSFRHNAIATIRARRVDLVAPAGRALLEGLIVIDAPAAKLTNRVEDPAELDIVIAAYLAAADHGYREVVTQDDSAAETRICDRLSTSRP